MSTSKQEPNFVSLDAEQWRRDIQTFASTTRQTLEAIVSELSNQCSSNPTSKAFPRTTDVEKPASGEPSTSSGSLATRVSTAGNRPARTPSRDVPSNRPERLAERTASRYSGSANSRDSKTTSSDDRLAKLKSKLAERLAKK